jgi:hypothetical protein
MDVKEYRRRYEAELAASEAASNADGLAESELAATATATANAEPAIRKRVADIQRAPLSRDTLSTDVPALLAMVRNPQEPVAVREAALQALGAATFLGSHFAPYWVEFLNTMRQLTQLDTPAELREKALGVLASEKDHDIQELLRSGLRNPQAAVVPAARALQLLSFDDHANIAGLAQEIFHQTGDLATKEAALRVLAADANSQDLLADLLQDKSQPRSLRALSATGLHSLNPQRFSSIARNIVMDDSDFEDIRATALGALANGPEHQALRSDSQFLEQVRQLGAQAPLPNLRAAAIRLMTRP